MVEIVYYPSQVVAIPLGKMIVFPIPLIPTWPADLLWLTKREFKELTPLISCSLKSQSVVPWCSLTRQELILHFHPGMKNNVGRSHTLSTEDMGDKREISVCLVSH